ncbi:MAG: branched-chain amino acid transporter AzlC [Ruminococcaceae bacterium]|nr:branched-chain amino acid transporter AzlC [Oscillospiraceae bacterium]
MKYKNDVKKAFSATVPVLMGYLALGFGFGVLLSTEGFSALWALFMSVTMFGGSMQYAAVDILADGVSLLSAAITTLIINSRHLFYGISLVDKYKDAGIKKLYMIHALTDETYSLVCSDELTKDVEHKHFYYFLVSILDHCYWIMGCVLGAVFGTNVTFNSEGIEFVLTALFLTIFVEQWLSSKDHLPAILGVCCAVVCTAVFHENMLIPTMVLILVALTVLRFVRRDKYDV